MTATMPTGVAAVMASFKQADTNIANWLVDSALVERSIPDVMRSFVGMLKEAGLPVHRLNCGSLQRHQIMGAVDSTWEEGSDRCEIEFVPRAVIRDNAATTPVGAMARSDATFKRYQLGNPEERSKFALLEKLHSRGYCDYLLMKSSYGSRQWHGFGTKAEGVFGSFATRQTEGFSETQIRALKKVWPTFALFLKSSTDRLLSAKLLEAYVGELPAHKILSGQVERGDGERIQCVLWCSDLRGSTRLSTNLPTDVYLDLLNDYFDCTAGSVLEYGGEVLKLIGDGVMAIFPFDSESGSKVHACSSALSAATRARAKAQALMAAGKSRSAKEISFGVGLHVGEVVLGNVGTTRRLDMTVTGAAANEVTRIEALTKTLGFSILASAQFRNARGDDLVSIGKYPVPDLGGTAELFTFVQTRS